jgi:hypothetical protein
MQKPTENKIKITTKQHHEFTFNGVTKKRSIDGRDTVYIVEENLDTFTIESSNTKITEEQTMLYIAICLLSLDPKLGLSFEIVFDSGSMAGVSVMQRDGILESVKLKYDDNKRKEICFILGVPKRTGTNEYNMSNHRVPVAVYALEKAFKMYDMEQPQNDIVAVVEQVENTDLVVTMVEPLPVVVGVDVTHAPDSIKAEKSETVEPKPKTEFERLLIDIDNMIQIAQDNKLAYVDRSRANTKLAVYASTLSTHLHQISSQYVREKYIAEKEYYRLYHEFLNDAKNMEGNNKKPSAAAADAHATQQTLELYEAADLSEELSKYINLRLKTIFEITRSVLQEVSNEKKNQVSMAETT